MNELIDTYDEVYSISDIHLGGPPGFQIFNHGPRLARFIGHITDEGPDRSVALVLNGDVIDSLAEDVGYVALDEARAADMIGRIMGDPAFAPVWDALARFVTSDRRHLVVVAGNHDIELSLPAVQAAIRKRLCGDDAEARSRLTFSCRGGGYSCRVGQAHVFFTHGNELDRFNRIDNEKLGQLVLAQNAGRKVDEDDWTPNFGTRLVVDVMNDVKRLYPFVDLLKPETGAVYGVLLLLGREVLKHGELADLVRLWRSHRRAEEVGGDLLSMDLAGPGSAGGEGDGADEPSIDDLLGPNMRRELNTVTNAQSEDDLLRMVDEHVIATGVEVGSPGGGLSGDDVETLGADDWVKRLWAVVSSNEEKKKGALRSALLDWRREEGEFGPDAIETEDRMSNWLRTSRAGAHFVVAGHTHKARSIQIRSGRSYYLNSGTWIRILEVPLDALEPGPNFDGLWDAVSSGTMEAIDKATISVGGKQSSVLMDFATAVHIQKEADSVVGSVVRIGRSGPPRTVDGSARTVRF